MKESVGIFKALLGSIKLYLSSYVYLLVPVLIMGSLQLMQPYLTKGLAEDDYIRQIVYGFVPSIVFMLVIGSFLTIVIYNILYRKGHGQPMRFDQTISQSLKNFFPMILFRLLIFGCAFIGTLAMALPFGILQAIVSATGNESASSVVSVLVGVFLVVITLILLYILLRIIFAEFLVATQGVGPVVAIKRSLALTKKRALNIFFIVLVSALFLWLISWAVATIMAMTMLDHTVVQGQTISDVATNVKHSTEEALRYVMLVQFVRYVLVGVFYQALVVYIYIASKSDQDEAEQPTEEVVAKLTTESDEEQPLS